MRKFSLVLLVLLVFSVYAEDEKEKEVDSVYADIIYLEREIVVGWVSVEDSDIVYLKNGKQIKGKVVERSPQQVKIEVTSESKKKVLNHEIVYRADEVEKVEIRLAKKKTSTLWKIAKGCIWGYIGISLFFCLKNGGSKVAKNNNQRF